ncbi:uncharacterized protein LOC116337868 [Contarinia nasturtii]|uniref:uncharacterized protein LOC116337868 n=1 Tax=Contarinia nasturtii TaxID=265458 RepID=UPI0012D46679|nr:uncharacterized protein LOC116337868 [Contarinia nasturtii]
MKSASILIVILFVASIAVAFNVSDEIKIDNLATTPEHTLNGSNDDAANSRMEVDIRIDKFNITKSNESIDFGGKSNVDIKNDDRNQTDTLITSSVHLRNSIQTHSTRTSRGFLGLFIIPYIVCFFVAKGFWPMYPSMLQYQVNEMGKKVFSQSDERIRQFCCGKLNFQESCYRPVLFKLVPVDPTDCPPLPSTESTPTTTNPAPPPASNAPQTWGNMPARIASKPSKTAQQNTDVEVFDSGKKPSPTKPDETPNINIEIHNVFSFGTTGNNTTNAQPPRTEQTDNKISISKNEQNNPPVIFA